MLEHTNAVHKITIIPRGRAGGYVLSLPNSDTNLRTREQLEDSLTATMGGRAAEEIIFGQITNGASGDLQQATNLSRAMVTQFGMSKSLGPRTFGSDSGNPFLGRGWVDERDYSEDAAKQIDEEIYGITATAYDRAINILKANRDKLELLAEILITNETLDRSEFEYLMEHGEMPSEASDVFDIPSLNNTPAANEPDSSDMAGGADAEGNSGSNLGPAPA
jgi:cell division protease FtsH